MSKLKYLIESKDFYDEIDDYLLSLIDDGFLSLENKPNIDNHYGISGSDFNPIISVTYKINSNIIKSTSELDNYWNNLRSLSTALKRSNCKFSMGLGSISIYFEMPDNLKKLFNDIGKQDEQTHGFSFVYNLSKNVSLRLDIEIDDNFDIFIDVDGISWECIGNLNKNPKLPKKLIKEFKEKYNFKYLSTYTEDRSLDPYGSVVHWKFQV